MTDKELAALLVLLRAGLWEKEPEDLSFFPLSTENWESVFRVAQCQTVTGIIWQGICFLPDNLLPPEALLLRWTAKTGFIEQKNHRMNLTLAGLYRFFRTEGLNPVLQKGQGVALLYECPQLRECGDIDFYFPSEEEGLHAVSLMCNSNHVVRSEADGSVHYLWNGTNVEHHCHLLDVNNPFKRNRAKKVENTCGFLSVSLPAAYDTEITVPSPLLNLLLLNTHIMKHAFGWGIGLRQLCDMARAYYCYHGGIASNEVRDLYRQIGIGKWSRLLHSFLQDYIGLSPDFLPYEDRRISSTSLLDVIMRGGNFGQYTVGRIRPTQTAWKQKLRTSRSFLSSARFSYRYAPNEAFWIFMNLLMGQVHVKR